MSSPNLTAVIGQPNEIIGAELNPPLGYSPKCLICKRRFKLYRQVADGHFHQTCSDCTCNCDTDLDSQSEETPYVHVCRGTNGKWCAGRANMVIRIQRCAKSFLTRKRHERMRLCGCTRTPYSVSM